MRFGEIQFLGLNSILKFSRIGAGLKGDQYQLEIASLSKSLILRIQRSWIGGSFFSFTTYASSNLSGILEKPALWISTEASLGVFSVTSRNCTWIKSSMCSMNVDVAGTRASCLWNSFSITLTKEVVITGLLASTPILSICGIKSNP